MNIKRLLIANRGEIAVRIARTAREMGIEPIAVYSEADAEGFHVKSIGRAFSLGPLIITSRRFGSTAPVVVAWDEPVVLIKLRTSVLSVFSC